MKRYIFFRRLCCFCQKRESPTQSVLLSSLSRLHAKRFQTSTVFKPADTSFTPGAVRCFSTGRILSQIFLPEEEVSVDDLVKDLIKSKPGKYKADVPLDDVYIIDHYPPKKFSVHDALEEVRRMDCWAYKGDFESRMVSINFSVDLVLQKKKKVQEGNYTLVPPHPIGSRAKFAVFAQDENARIAKEMGADLVVEPDDLDSILTEPEELQGYQGFLSTPDMLPKISALKRYLKINFPTMKRGTVSKNLPLMLFRYLNGNQYTLLSKHPEVSLQVGNLNLTNQQIEENIAFFLEHIAAQKPTEFGPIVQQKGMSLTASLLDDSFLIDASEYLPEFDEEEEEEE